ncbi:MULTISPECIES: GH39 family glycosyl hydrolase [unclassified Rathayibacter]|uniref:GH39 family glycosyl hydrolase n=1 Tax=unclassified Rathayibacter TaxID=2609250 RepID=UPI000F4C6765|nr:MULTISPECIES: beta-xylosidase [unclassified Rathayibacter]ROP49104.1 xylan 1,4-beta-xylosidase [Rathayibacter sp. PhB186]ROS50779.1 xylan 1,4-beta-xylosidase [Rathayibacter sp. PhB185]
MTLETLRSPAGREASPLATRADASGVPLRHFWNVVVGAGRANEGLRADWQGQLQEVVDVMGFRYVRFHGLFHDDMFVYREVGGRVEPYFQYVDQLVDRLLEMGIRPFVEFAFMPTELARETGTVFWWGANGAPPTDYDKWEQLVRATTEHWAQRYGLDEIRTWYFEVWNEPNLEPFFRGTRSEYFELYRRTVRAVRAIDPALRVGGPATSNFVPDARFAGETEDISLHTVGLDSEQLDRLDWQPVWLQEFLEYAAAESLPVDFVSVHPYPTDWALDEHGRGARLTRGVDATATDLATVRGIVDASAFPTAEIHLTEWSSSSSPRDYTHDHLQAATFIVKTNLDSIGTVDSLAYWTFTDIFEENGGGQEPFHGGFGMLTQHGIPKPSYHAYRFLSSLGDEVLTLGSHGVVTRDSATGRLTALLHHYPDDVTQSVPASFDSRDVAEATLRLGSVTMLPLRLEGLEPGSRFVIEIVDEVSGNAMHEWRRIGSPLNLSRTEAAAIDAFARATRRLEIEVDASGVLELSLAVEPWSIVLVQQES